MTNPHDPRNFFTTHHAAYVTSARHAHGADLTLLIDGLYPEPGESALDIATGGGHTAIALAKKALDVTVLDMTPAMLKAATDFATTQGVQLSSVEGVAEHLPFSDSTFHIVTCRRAAHHFQSVPQFLQESLRVLRPGGRIGISDMTSSSANLGWLNQLEIVRDPSHYHTLSIDEWYDALRQLGWDNIVIHLSDDLMSPEEWLSPVSSQTENGQKALHMIRSGDAPVEFRIGDHFVKRRLILWAEKPMRTE